MAGIWTDLTQRQYGSGRRIDTTLWTALADNDEAASEHVFEIRKPAEGLTSSIYPTFTTIWQIEARMPSFAAALRWTFEAFRESAGGTGTLRLRLASVVVGPEITVTEPSPTYVDKTVAIVSGITAYRGTIQLIELQLAVNAGTTSINTRCINMLSARWSFD